MKVSGLFHTPLEKEPTVHIGKEVAWVPEPVSALWSIFSFSLSE
jgi:hypothetical protein